MRTSLIGALQAYTQAIPQMAVQGGDPSEIVRKVADVIRARQKGRAVEDVISEVFAPEQQVPPAGAMPSAVEQPSPAPQGAPVGGSSPQLPPQEAAPQDIQSILATLTAGGGATGRATTVASRRIG